MEFLDKLTKKASETYKGAAEKTSKFAKETKLKMKINDNKSKIDDLYKEIGKKVYQKHVAGEELDIKSDLELECGKVDDLNQEIEGLHKEIVDLSNCKICESCKQEMDKNAKFCPKCGAEQPEIEVVTPEQPEIEVATPEQPGAEANAEVELGVGTIEETKPEEDKQDGESVAVEFIPDQKLEETETKKENEE